MEFLTLAGNAKHRAAPASRIFSHYATLLWRKPASKVTGSDIAAQQDEHAATDRSIFLTMS